MFKKVLLFLFIMFFLTGCMPSPIEHSNNNSFDRQMISRSLSSIGNTYRINNILKNKDSIVIAFTGSSAFIEENDSFSSELKEKITNILKKNTNIKLLNYSFYGVNSTFVDMTIKNHLLKNKPDIIFLDFLVFDGHEQEDRESFERLVKACVEQENEPQVVIFLNAKADGNINTEYMEQIAKYYNLPVINAQTAILPEITSGRKNVNDIFEDKNQYTEEGKKYVADFCANYIKFTLKNKKDKIYNIPNAMNQNISDFIYLNAQNITTENDETFKVQNFPQNKIFKNGIEISKETKTPFTFIEESNNIYIVLQVSPCNNSIAEIFINGKKTMDIDTNSSIEMPKIYKVYSGTSQEKTAVSIKVKDKENKEENNEGSIDKIILYGIAYSQSTSK